MRLALDQIRIDGGTQPRIGIDYDVAYSYGDLMADGVKFPPVTVFYDGSSYWLADGFHRYHAASSQDIAEIEADVIQGTIEDAQWYSFGANKAHGLMRSNDDKQRAVKAALAHPKCAGLSDRAIARHLGVASSMVGDWRKKIGASLAELQMQSTRTATRNGKTYEMDTSNIGKRAAESTEQRMEQPHESHEEQCNDMHTESQAGETIRRPNLTGNKLKQSQEKNYQQLIEGLARIDGAIEGLQRLRLEYAVGGRTKQQISDLRSYLRSLNRNLNQLKNRVEESIDEYFKQSGNADDSSQVFEGPSFSAAGNSAEQVGGDRTVS